MSYYDPFEQTDPAEYDYWLNQQSTGEGLIESHLQKIDNLLLDEELKGFFKQWNKWVILFKRKLFGSPFPFTNFFNTGHEHYILLLVFVIENARDMRTLGDSFRMFVLHLVLSKLLSLDNSLIVLALLERTIKG